MFPDCRAPTNCAEIANLNVVDCGALRISPLDSSIYELSIDVEVQNPLVHLSLVACTPDRLFAPAICRSSEPGRRHRQAGGYGGGSPGNDSPCRGRRRYS